MKILSFEETKTIELNILKDIHSFCTRNNITYFLTFGTLIGAIRHNGFIPWDDDIDIFIPRGDYEKFIQLYRSEKYVCYALENNGFYPFSYAKVIDKSTIKKEPVHISKKISLGIDVDVFPLNPYYEEGYDKKINKKWHFYRRLWHISISRFRKNNLLKTICCFPAIIILRPFCRVFAKKISNLTLFKITNQKPIGFITAFCTSEKIRVYNPDWFEKAILHKFQDFDFFIPSGYDELLRSIYGDYMMLPPQEKRISHHTNICYSKK